MNKYIKHQNMSTHRIQCINVCIYTHTHTHSCIHVDMNTDIFKHGSYILKYYQYIMTIYMKTTLMHTHM